MNKAIAQRNRTRTADIYCAGHFHQVFDGGNFVQNGSMIGYNAFAMAIKAAYEPPAQVMFAISPALRQISVPYHKIRRLIRNGPYGFRPNFWVMSQDDATTIGICLIARVPASSPLRRRFSIPSRATLH